MPEEQWMKYMMAQLARIEDKQDKMLTRAEFREFKEEVDEKIDKIEEDVDSIRSSAVTPHQITTMIGEGLQKSEARGLTSRDRRIRYGLALLSLGTFLLLVLQVLKDYAG
jgi:hypothetical protein